MRIAPAVPAASAAIAGAVIALLASVAVAQASGQTATKHSTGPSKTAKPRCGVVSKPVSRNRKAGAPPPPITAVDPFTTKGMRAYLSTRGGSVTAAVDDLVTGQMWVYNPGVRHVTASIIKVDILETLLRQSDLRQEPFDGASPSTIAGMIQESDNDDATDLWDRVGGPGAVGAYNSTAGLTQTSPNVAWGLTTTSAADQVRLLCQLVEPDSLLPTGAQDYALSLMQSVDPAQAWGVSGGVPAGVTVALKNGWLPLTSGYDWEINSIGRVKGEHRRYLIAVLTAGEPYAYGIDTISGLSGRVWNDLKPVKPRAQHKRKRRHKKGRPYSIKP